MAHNLTENDILNDLIKNIKNDNFILHFQPKFKIVKNGENTTKKLIGAEVLVRRFDVNLNEIIYPNNFIAFYEQAAIIRHLDLHVFEKACKTFDQINSKRITSTPFYLNVNFSCATLLEFDFISNIKSICDKYSVEYNNIMIEIAKDEYLSNHANFIRKNLIELSKLGFLLSLSHYSSNFKEFYKIPNVNFHEIKINTKHFFKDRINFRDFKKYDIPNAVAKVYDDCDVLIIGVENDVQADFFYDKYCQFQQGFYYSKPLPIEEFLEKFVI